MTFINSGGEREAASWSTAWNSSFFERDGSVSSREMIILSEKLAPRRKSMLRVISLSGGNIRSILPSKRVVKSSAPEIRVTASASQSTHF